METAHELHRRATGIVRRLRLHAIAGILSHDRSRVFSSFVIGLGRFGYNTGDEITCTNAEHRASPQKSYGPSSSVYEQEVSYSYSSDPVIQTHLVRSGSLQEIHISSYSEDQTAIRFQKMHHFSYWTIVSLCRCSMSWYTLRGVGHCLPLFILDNQSINMSNEWAYTVLVKTGTPDNAGTDANVSLKLAGPDLTDPPFYISNLVSWGGAMEKGRDYFENGQIDVFKGTGPRLPKPPCWMELSHDNTGNKPGWYVEYVEVFTFPAGQHQGWFQHFDVNQWLALDENPYQLFAERNNCNN